jgi:hypothetical protein
MFIFLFDVSFCCGGNNTEPHNYVFQAQDKLLRQTLKNYSSLTGYKIIIKDMESYNLDEKTVTIKLNKVSMSYGLRRILASVGVTSCAIVVNEELNTTTVFILDYPENDGKLNTKEVSNQRVEKVSENKEITNWNIPPSEIVVPAVMPGDRPLTQKDLDIMEQRAFEAARFLEGPDLAPPR